MTVVLSISRFSEYPHNDGNIPGLKPFNNGRMHSVYLLKISKTGSTTLAQTFLKMACWNRIKMAIYYDEPVLESVGSIPNPGPLISMLVPVNRKGQSSKYNMIMQHSVYIQRDVEAVLESPITYVTFIRNPLDRFRSYLHTEANVHHFRLQVEGDIAQIFLDSYNRTGWMTRMKLSWQLFDRTWLTFFFNTNMATDQSTLLKTLQKVKKHFVIGVTEHYELSMVLLRRKLKLNLREILYIPMRISKYRVQSIQTKLLKQFCRLAPNDCFIYEYLKNAFWETVRMQPDDIFNEVEYFIQIQNQIDAYCKRIAKSILYMHDRGTRKSIFSPHKPFVVGTSTWSAAFQFTPEECIFLRLDEIPMYPLIYFRQNPATDCNNLTECPYIRTELNLCRFICKIAKMPLTVLIEEMVSNNLSNFIWD